MDSLVPAAAPAPADDRDLKTALAERGLPVIAEVRRDARQGFDVPHAAMTALNLLWMDSRRPWATRPPTVFSPLRRALAVVLAPPVLVVTFGIDFALRPFMRGRSNAYRILARKL